MENFYDEIPVEEKLQKRKEEEEEENITKKPALNINENQSENPSIRPTDFTTISPLNNNSQIEEESQLKSKYKLEILSTSAQESLAKNNITTTNFKIIIIGDEGVGKTSLSLRSTTGTFKKSYSPTIGFDIFTFAIKINDFPIKLQIWDTCGQEEFSSSTPSLYKDTALAIVVYSVDNIRSFENLDFWVNEVRNNSRPDTIIFMVGNKGDLTDRRVVSKREGEKKKEDKNFGFFCETSAKIGFNVNLLFEKISVKLYEKYVLKLDGEINEIEDFRHKGSVSLKKENHIDKKIKKRKCC